MSATATVHDATDAHAPDQVARPDRFVVALAVIAVVGLVGRVVYILKTQADPIIGDGLVYSSSPRLLLDGKGYINPLALMMNGTVVEDATHPPAWTMVLTLASALGARSDEAHQIVAALVGTGSIVMTGLAGRRAFGRRVGLVAAAIVCVYPNIWLYEREVLAEPLAMLGVATIIWLTYRFRDAPSLAGALALGALTGLLALTRSELILVGAVVVAPVVLGRSSIELRRRVGWLVGAGAVTLALLAPWAAFNATRFEAPVVLSTGLGNAMATGNCAQTYSGEKFAYYEWGCTLFIPGKSTDPSVADGQARSAAITFMKANAGQVPGVMAARVGRTFNVFRPFQQVELEGERGSRPWVLQAALVGYWLLLPFAVAGVVVARRSKVPLYPLLAFPLIVLISVLPTIGAVRYRAPAEIALALLAAAGIDAVLRWWSRRGEARAAASGPAPAAGVG